MVAGVLWWLQDEGVFSTVFESFLGMISGPLLDPGTSWSPVLL